MTPVPNGCVLPSVQLLKTVMTCDDCKMGVQAAIDQLLSPESIDAIVDFLANGEFCANNGDERCPAAVDAVIRQGLPMLAAMGDDAAFAEACNAVPGTCPAKKLRLF